MIEWWWWMVLMLMTIMMLMMNGRRIKYNIIYLHIGDGYLQFFRHCIMNNNCRGDRLDDLISVLDAVRDWGWWLTIYCIIINAFSIHLMCDVSGTILFPISSYAIHSLLHLTIAVTSTAAVCDKRSRVEYVLNPLHQVRQLQPWFDIIRYDVCRDELWQGRC